MKEQGFEPAGHDCCMYVRRDDEGNPTLIIVAYVDDCIVISPPEQSYDRDSFVKTFNSKYEIVDQGDLSWHLGVSYERNREKGWLKAHQERYVINSLEKFGMEGCNPKKTPLPSGVKTYKATDGNLCS
eukprot:1512468-Rhodomonas_salina.4